VGRSRTSRIQPVVGSPAPKKVGSFVVDIYLTSGRTRPWSSVEPSRTTASSRSSAKAAWASSMRPRTRSSNAASRSSSSPHIYSNDNEAEQRFLRDAKAAAALDHPNICTIYQIAEANGKTFLAMAFLKGETLEDRIPTGPLPLKDALDFGRQVAEGLQAAHVEGIVHRDIKPAKT